MCIVCHQNVLKVLAMGYAAFGAAVLCVASNRVSAGALLALPPVLFVLSGRHVYEREERPLAQNQLGIS
jgi:hypothetical protein